MKTREDPIARDDVGREIDLGDIVRLPCIMLQE